MVQYLQYLKKLSMIDLNCYQTAMFVYSTLHNLSPKCVSGMFITVASVHSHSTRKSNLLFTNSFVSNIRKHSVAITGPQIWNSIPTNITEHPSLSLFKKSYKNHLISK